MKKKLLTTGLLFIAGAGLILPGCASLAHEVDTPETVDYGPAPTFEPNRIVNVNKPDYRVADDEEFVSAKKVILHYHNDDKGCLNRRFYTWVTGVDGKERKPDSVTWTTEDMSIILDFSEITEYADMDGLYFIIKMAGTWAGQSEDMFLSYKEFAPDENGLVEVWMIPGEGSKVEIYKTEAETKFPKVKTAKFIDYRTIECVADETPMYYKLYAYDKEYLLGTTEQKATGKEFRLFKQSSTNLSTKFRIQFNYTAKLNIQYVIETEYASNPGRIQSIIVSSENLYEYKKAGESITRFDKYYTYDGNDLGVSKNGENTVFKVWSPISSLVTLNLYTTGTPRAFGGSDSYTTYYMNYTKGGVWQIELVGDISATPYYTYSFTHSGGTVEACDPYAKAVGINGMRGYVYDAALTNPTGWDDVPLKWDGVSGYDIATPQDLSVYEVHIRDLTMDESWNGTKTPGTYQAFIEKGTHLKGHDDVTTGFDHLTELGVKAVQLLPVFDQDNDERAEKMKFNWGYNPLNYNCVEGGYSSDPYNPTTRITEFKQLVQAFANNGNHTRVIMDVVYNHVSSASASCFNKAMPKYYFRYTENWEYYDGSGCNNEVKTDAKMMSKYIVDSLCWWAKEYKIKGFRFDLMGLIDSWTLMEAKNRLYEIDPDIVMYGEGWTSGGYHGKYELDSDGQLKMGGTETSLVYHSLWDGNTFDYFDKKGETLHGGIGAFNDTGRNATKGSNDGGYGTGNLYPGYGFISQGDDVGDKSNKVADMMKGIHSDKGGNPTQTVNYVSCHDNYTLWDQLRVTLANSRNDYGIPTSETSVHNLVQGSIACHASVMMSNAIAFMQGGEELYRTKEYDPEDLKELCHSTYSASGKGTKGDEADIVRPYPTWPSWDQAAKDPTTGNPSEVLATDEVWIDGKIVSHNSYKSNDNVNSFKWDRKLEVNGTDVSGYFDIWKKMVKTHNEFKKYGYPLNTEQGTMDTWGNGDGACTFAMWNADVAKSPDKGYYFVFANRMGRSIGIDLSNTTMVFCTNEPTYNGGTLNLAPFTFVCYRKG